MRRAVVIALAIICTPVFADKPPDWKEPSYIASLLTVSGIKAGLPRGLAHCVAYEESRFTPAARSRVVDGYRSCGLMQIYRRYIVELVARYSSHPATFDWRNPSDNAEVGCKYLAYLIDYFGGSVYLGILAYNAGPTTVRNMKSLDDIPPECVQYADNVLALLDEWNDSWR